LVFKTIADSSSAPRFPWTHHWGILPPSLKEVSMAKSKAERGRFSSRKKMEVVLRVLRGDDLDVVSREAGITAAKVSEWRDQFVASGQAGLKSRAADGHDDELVRLKALVGDLTMRLELSREAVQRLRGGAPLATGRSTR
jgi:transposase